MPVRTFQEVERMSVLPPSEKWTRTGVTLPDKLLGRLEELRTEVNAEREKPDRLSRDRFFQLGLEWFEKELTAERKKAKR